MKPVTNPESTVPEIKPGVQRTMRLRLPGTCLALAISAMLPLAVAQASDSTASAVGEVSLVLGKAYLESSDGNRHALRMGSTVRATDRIVTSANGHVHIRFVDDALVSVRPDSRLEIQRYDYNPDQPAQSAIRLNLEEGVTRSISGRGASAARDRFRLNTPIAAIGVRGTDFVVSSSPGAVRALVNEGAIVLAPFSDDCVADAFGPCSENAIELAQSSLEMIELDQDVGLPRVMSAQMQRDAESVDAGAERLVAENNERTAEDKTVGTDDYLENVTSRRWQADVEESVTSVTPPVPVPDVTPPVQVASTELTSRQLVWGRYADEALNNERITLPYQQARAGRDTTVASGEYVLYRDGGGSERVQAGLGNINFGLASAQAFFHHSDGSVSMIVSGGSLAINFENSTFNTELDMTHAMTGDVQFSASGRIYEGGYFHTRSETERMAGAVSLDGREAGYFFEKQLENGGIQGLTLWDSQ